MSKRPRISVSPPEGEVKAEPTARSDPAFGVDSDEEGEEGQGSVVVQFTSLDGDAKGPKIDIPLSSTVIQMEELLNQLLENKQKVPYSFFAADTEIQETLGGTIDELKLGTELVLPLVYQPMAVFRVRPVTRCTDTIPGHTEAILHVSYSPNGKCLASGGGDFTVRFWDVNTCLPKHTCRGHKHHVLCTAWSPDGKRFVSGDRHGEIRIWNPETGEQVGQPLKGHKQWITGLAWEPMHRNSACERLASSSKDSTVKIWNFRTGQCVGTLSGHADSVECICWGGEGLLYSGSRDRTIKVWNVERSKADSRRQVGILVRTLVGHGHRVNTLALSCEDVLRTGPFGYRGGGFDSPEAAKEAAQARYDEARSGKPEALVSGSDDFTLFLWNPAEDKKPIARLTGHQQAVNHIAFSPDGNYFASASFDKKVKVWNGKTGKFIATLTGHVGAVYRVAWSADSRLLVSASKDSTVKLWEMSSLKRAKATLPGHADEVFALAWSPSGEQVASGSKDRTIKIWRN